MTSDYVLSPATRLLWRTPDSVHLELGGRAVVLDNVQLDLVRGLIGTAPADAALLPKAVLTELRESGYVWRRSDDDPRRPPVGPPVDRRRTPPTPGLAGELLSLAARHGEHAAELLDARRHAVVVVSGSGRTGALIAAGLAASGVGRVHSAADGVTRLRHVLPGGATPFDEGRSLASAAESAVLRAAPGTETAPPSPGEPPDLVVLAADEPVDEQRRQSLHADGVAHLPVSVGLAHGSVGPLVVPGLTSCLRCAELHRRDREPHWAALSAQLAISPRYGPASDVAVAMSLVAATVVQVLAFLDGGDPAAVDGSLEVHLPDWRLRRRSRPHHPECDCTAASTLSPLGTMGG